VRFTTLLVASALLGVLAPLPLGSVADAQGKSTRPDIMKVGEIKPGMKGYGLTVFEGTKPGKFDVEVIDVLKNFRPRQDLILIKTKHPRLEVAKVVAGMSGSPIFLNGKMIGAYSYGWTFGAEPVAGVTPISLMLDDLARPLPKTIDGWPIHPVPGAKALGTKQKHASRGFSKDRWSGKLADYDVLAHAKQLAQRQKKMFGATTAATPVSTPLLIGGMSSGAVELAKDLLSPFGLEPLQAGGSGGTDPNAPNHFEDGGAIGVELIRGDMSAQGLGTVTRVEGTNLVAFGHPMMESGVTALPTSIGKVLWFLASDMRSFKIGMPVRPLGALLNDRQTSIVCSETVKAPTIPVHLRIKGVPGLPDNEWNFEVAHEKFMTPSFLAIALGSGIQTAANEKQDVSWTAKSRIKVKKYGEIALEDFGVSVGGTPDPNEFIRSNLVRAVGALMNNVWEPVIIESADVEVELKYAREILRLRGAEVLDPEADAGESARIRLTLVPYVGKEFTKVVSVPLPEHLAGKTLTLEIGPGYMERKEQADPENVTDLVSNLQNPLYPIKSVVVSYSDNDGAVAYKGRVAKNLPPGALDALRPTTASVAPDSFKTETRIVIPIGEFMVGQDRVEVTVKPVLR
jgi:SpoIVB peptidase S55